MKSGGKKPKFDVKAAHNKKKKLGLFRVENPRPLMFKFLLFFSINKRLIHRVMLKPRIFLGLDHPYSPGFNYSGIFSDFRPLKIVKF